MAKYDYGGGCACGLYRACACDDSRGKNEVDKHGKSRMWKPKKDKQYILIRAEGVSPIILNGQEQLFKSFNSDLSHESDRYFELGPEVDVKMVVSVKPKGAVYRGSNES